LSICKFLRVSGLSLLASQVGTGLLFICVFQVPLKCRSRRESSPAELVAVVVHLWHVTHDLRKARTRRTAKPLYSRVGVNLRASQVLYLEGPCSRMRTLNARTFGGQGFAKFEFGIYTSKGCCGFRGWVLMYKG
jgi:hypothetical protein